jgi:hypothetical protein
MEEKKQKDSTNLSAYNNPRVTCHIKRDLADVGSARWASIWQRFLPIFSIKKKKKSISFLHVNKYSLFSQNIYIFFFYFISH